VGYAYLYSLTVPEKSISRPLPRKFKLFENTEIPDYISSVDEAKVEELSREETSCELIHTGSKEVAAKLFVYNDNQNTKITIEQHKGIAKYR